MLLEQPPVISQQDLVDALYPKTPQKPIQKTVDAFRNKVFVVGCPRQSQVVGRDCIQVETDLI